MKKRGQRWSLFLSVIAVAITLGLMSPANAAYASSGGSGTTPPPVTSGSELEITNYTVYKGGVVNTGSILKGDVITVVVNILDKRITSGSATPIASLNTASYSLWSSADITQPQTTPASAIGLGYTVTFNNCVYTGVGNTFTFAISYNDASPPVETVSKDITLNQSVAETEKKEAEVTTKGTGFVLKDTRYGDGVIYAGKPFDLSAVILATNGSVPVENVTATFVPPEHLTLAGGASVVYIGTMAPNASATVKTTLLPGGNITEGSYSINIEIKGVNQKTGEAVSAQMTVSVPVLQPERFEIFKVQTPTDLTAGVNDGMGYGSITLVNQGKGTVSNVSIDVIGTGLSTEDGRQYIGNVGPGEKKDTDFTLKADAAGQVDALVSVTYENARGEQKTLEHGFTVTVREPAPEEPDGGTLEVGAETGTSKGIPRLVWIAIGVAVVVVVLAVLIRVRKKRLAAAEAALDADGADDDEDMR